MDAQELFDAEFRGFFWGEGYISAHTYQRKFRGKPPIILVRAVVKISVRNDDIEMLRAFQRRFGGYLYDRFPKEAKPYRSNPSCQWLVTNQDELREIHRVLSKGVLPAKKRRDVELFGELLTMLHGRGKKYTTDEKARLYEFIEAFKGLHAYTSQDDQVISA